MVQQISVAAVRSTAQSQLLSRALADHDRGHLKTLLSPVVELDQGHISRVAELVSKAGSMQDYAHVLEIEVVPVLRA